MDPITTSALIYGGTALAGMGAQAGANYKNRKMMREGQEFEKEMWNASNLYNSPEAQMERLKQAGLNPNLIYGTGTVSGNTAPASQPKAHVAQVESVMRNTQPFNYMEVLGQYQSYNNAKEQNRVLKTSADLNQQRIETEKFNTILRQAQGFGLQQDTKFKSQLIDTQKSILTQQLRSLELDTMNKSFNIETMNPLRKQETEKRIMLMGIDAYIKNAEKDLMQLRKQGMKQDIDIKQNEIDNLMQLRNSILSSEEVIKFQDMQKSSKLAPYGLGNSDWAPFKATATFLENLKNKF